MLAARLFSGVCWILAAGAGLPLFAAELLEDLPAAFEGELPCADCPGIFYHLDLLPGGTFFMRSTFLGRGTAAINDQIGSWKASDGAIHLDLASQGPSTLHIVDRHTLRVVDGDGPHAEASLGHDLRRKDSMGTISPRLNLVGFFDGTSRFKACDSGRRFTVVAGRNLSALQETGPALVSLQASVSYGPVAGLHLPEVTLPAEILHEVRPGERCPSPNASQ